jgi:hypothetical protein
MAQQISRSTGAVVFIISRIEPTAPENLEDRLMAQLGVAGDERFRTAVRTVRANSTKFPVDNSRPADMTAAQRRVIDAKIDCAMSALNATCPLQPGEKETAASEGGLMSAQWQDLPAGTPLVTRTTNYATVHMAWPHLRAEKNDLVNHTLKFALLTDDPNPCWKWDRPIPDDSNAHTLYNWITTQVAAILAASGFNFLSPFLTFAGTVEFKSVSFKDVFQIATCRAQKVAKGMVIEAITGSLTSMNQELHDTYLPAKQQIQGKTGSERTKKMSDAYTIGYSILTTIRGNLGQLSGDDMGFDGLVPYVAGAGVVLSLYQELSTVDSSGPPGQSSSITSMKLFAGEAAGHVQTAVGSIRSRRSSAIAMQNVYHDITHCAGMGASRDCVVVGSKLVGATWQDQITGESSSDTYTAGSRTPDSDIPGLVSQCQANMEAHRQKILSDLDAKLKPLLDMAAKFGQMPIPPALPA